CSLTNFCCKAESSVERPKTLGMLFSKSISRARRRRDRFHQLCKRANSAMASDHRVDAKAQLADRIQQLRSGRAAYTGPRKEQVALEQDPGARHIGHHHGFHMWRACECIELQRLTAFSKNSFAFVHFH